MLKRADSMGTSVQRGEGTKRDSGGFMHGQSYRPDEPEGSVMSRDILFHARQHH